MMQMVLDRLPILMESLCGESRISLRKEKNGVGFIPLSYAALKGYFEEVCYMLKHIPDYATKCNEDGSSPIHNAIVGGNVYVVKEFLLRCPEALYHVDAQGRSILHIVVEYARADVLSYLRENPKLKQLFHIRDATGHTFADLAKQQVIKRNSNEGAAKCNLALQTQSPLPTQSPYGGFFSS